MDRDDIIKMAKEAGASFETAESMFKFATLVAAAEHEACAKVCEDEASRAKWNWGNDLPQNQPFWNGGEQLASSCAAAIRARGEQ